MEEIIAVFVGGPRDGETIELERLEHRWMMPAPRPLTLDVRDATLDPADLMMTVAVYYLATDPAMGRPSINDVGHYRYEFEGYQ